MKMKGFEGSSLTGKNREVYEKKFSRLGNIIAETNEIIC